jgi:UPF0176 protein
MLSIINVSAYRFVHLAPDILPILQVKLKSKTKELALKGTILLSSEGINLFLSGGREAITSFYYFLHTSPYFKDIRFKESLSNFHPFQKMLVKLKKEIIPFGIDSINPGKYTAPYVSPEQLKVWLKERPDLVLLDTRNTFEVELGSFENALDLGIRKFRDFPEAVKKLPEELKKLPIVTFCTGGIRCEKAAAYLLNEGFKEIYQLEGGILNYFEKCGGNHFKGPCFVFDKREKVNSTLENFY